VLAIAGSTLIYMLPGRASGPASGGPFAALRVARRHLSLLAAAILLLLAAGTWLDGFSLLLSPTGLIQARRTPTSRRNCRRSVCSASPRRSAP